MKERTISRTIASTEYAVTGIDLTTSTIAVRKVILTGNDPDVSTLLADARTADFAPAMFTQVGRTTKVYTVTESAFIALAERQKIKAETEVETKAETEVETKAETKAETEAETKAETEVETKAETKAETEVETKAE